MGRSEPGVCKRKGRAERGLFPRAGQDPQLGKQVCHLMSALTAEGEAQVLGNLQAEWLANFGVSYTLYQSNPYLISSPPPTIHTTGL